MLDKIPLNFNLLFNPANWLIVILMIGLGAIIITFVLAAVHAAPKGE